MKKDKQAKPGAATGEDQKPLLSFRQWQHIAVGVIIVAAGFYTLSQSDPAGRNWASHLAPLLILGGYFFIGFTLWNKDE